MLGWKSPVYGFYQPEVVVGYLHRRKFHEFSCAKKGCGTKIRRYLDASAKNKTGQATNSRSTSNLRGHAKACFGKQMVKSVAGMKIDVVRQKILGKMPQRAFNAELDIKDEHGRTKKLTFTVRNQTPEELRCVLTSG